MKRITWFLCVAALLAAATGCNKEDEPLGTAVFRVKMVDAPAAYDAVNVEILSMKAKIDSAWIELPVAVPGVYDLLDFSGGNSVLMIGDTALTAGTMTELRLILGSNNTVVVDSVTYDLTTPSGQTSGYKVKMDPFQMVSGGVYNLVIDFDANKSVHQTGNENYMLKPVVTGYLETALGGIVGDISPVNAAWWVEASNATDTAGTAIDTATGQFLISTVPPGTYNVTFTANPGFGDTTLTGVVVVAGQVTQVGTVVFP